MTVHYRGSGPEERTLSSDAEISAWLRRLADQMKHTPSDSLARFDELMDIHDQLVELARELRRQIDGPD
jgi:hypothetical protein